MEGIKITAIIGSLRRDSYNRQLAVEAGRLIGSRAKFQIMDYTDVPLMNQDIEYPAPDAVVRARETVKSADGIWFFTPEYNHSIPGVLKNLIDWLSRPISDSESQVLGGKPATLSGVSLGISGTGIVQDHLVAIISLLNMKVMNQPRLTIPNAMQQTDQNGRLALTSGAAFLENQVNKFIHFVETNRK